MRFFHSRIDDPLYLAALNLFKQGVFGPLSLKAGEPAKYRRYLAVISM